MNLLEGIVGSNPTTATCIAMQCICTATNTLGSRFVIQRDTQLLSIAISLINTNTVSTSFVSQQPMYKNLHSTFLFVFIAGIAIGSFGTQARADLRGSGVFSDVPVDAYYDDAVGEMYSKGIITGYADGRFGPNDTVTRGQVAVIMKRFMDQSGGGTAKSSSTSSSSSTATTTNNNGEFRFTIDEFSLLESTPNASITVLRTGGNTGAASVQYETVNGSAVGGEDFTIHTGRLDFADGESSKTISISITNDEDGEEDEEFTVRLKSPTGGAELSTPDEVTVKIMDNDENSAGSSSQEATENGSLIFDAAAYSISEDAGTLKVYVRRSSGTTGAVTVDYQTVNGTAVSGTEFDSANGTLTFPAGNDLQSFTVTIHNNTSKKGNKVFSVRLLNATGGAIISNTEANITIADDETVSSGSGSLRFDDNEYVVVEGHTAVVTVERIGGSAGELSADYTTVNGTAKSGFDYDSVSGTITFREGESQKTLEIQTTDDAQNDPNEAFSISLSAGSHDTSLSTPSTSTINISE